MIISMTGRWVEIARILTLKAGLKIEATTGMRRHGRSCYAIVKEEFGFRGNKKNVLRQLEQWIEKELIVKDPRRGVRD